MKIEDDYPWLDKNGKPLLLKKLKKVVQNWSPETWSRYLESLETYQREYTPEDLDLYDELTHTRGLSEFFKSLPTPDYYLEKNLRAAINQLTENQKKVLLGLYYFKASQRQLAEELSVSKTAIYQTKERALTSLRRILTSPSTYICNFGHKNRHRDQIKTEITLSEGINNLIQQMKGGDALQTTLESQKQ